MVSPVAFRWDSFSLSVLDDLGFGAGLPRAVCSSTGVLIGVAYDGSNSKAVKWIGDSISLLDDVTPGGNTSAIESSSDGSIFIGIDNGTSSIIRWTGSGTTGSILTPGTGYPSQGYSGPEPSQRAISDDGTINVGSSLSGPLLSRATFWSSGTPTLLALGTGFESGAVCCTPNGLLIFGFSTFGSSIQEGVYWSAGSMYLMSSLTHTGSSIHRCTGQNSLNDIVVYGTSEDGSGFSQAVYWDGLNAVSGGFFGTIHQLDALPGGSGANVTWCASDLVSGSPVAVGYADDVDGNNWATKWNGTAATNLGGLPGSHESRANGCSTDGSIVVGISDDADYNTWPVYWDASNVIHKLPTIADPTDGYPGEALGISLDGLVIFGDGDPPSGNFSNLITCSTSTVMCGFGPIPIFPLLPQGFPVKVTPMMDTTIGIVKALREVRSPNQVYPLWEFDILFEELRDQTQNQVPYNRFLGFQQYEELVQLWLMMYGQTNVFAFNCPWDNSRSNQQIAIGDGTSDTFTVVRTWGYGDTATFEPVGVVNSVSTVYVNGSPISSGDYAIDRNKIIFTTPPDSGDTIVMTFSYYYLCRFIADEQDFEEFSKNRWTVPSLKFQSVIWP